MGKARIWKEQWDRVHRWYARIKVQDRCRQEYEDDLWAFFQNCWHMKDWLINDPILGLNKKTVTKEAHALIPLTICADLANGSKHLKLKPDAARRNAAMSGRDIHVRIHTHFRGKKQRARVRVRWDYRVTYCGQRKKKALALASEAIDAWEEVFQKLGVN